MGAPNLHGYASLQNQKDKLYHMGIRGNVSRSTLADADERRDWRIYADLAQSVIRIARSLYADEELGLDLDNAVYSLDASTIDLCLSLYGGFKIITDAVGTCHTPAQGPVRMVSLVPSITELLFARKAR
jgi:hypothetical protein